MCLVSRKTNIAYSIGNCPEYPVFCALKKRRYEEDPTAMDTDLKLFEERGFIKVNKVNPNSNKKELTLTITLKEGNQKIKEEKIECVDQIQGLFLISHLGEMTKNGCCQPCCELPLCIINKLTAVL